MALKRILFSILIMTLVISCLAGCGDGDKETEATPETTTPAPSVTEPVGDDVTEPPATEPVGDDITEPPVTEPTSNGEVAATITITDSIGNAVEIPQPLERVALVYPYHLEVFQALGAEEQVNSIPDGSAVRYEMFRSFMGKPEAGHFRSAANIELLVELDTQVVISLTDSLSVEELDDRLAPFGIPVVRMDLYKIDTLAQEVETLGKMLGKEEEAQAYIGFFQEYLDLIQERLADFSEETKTSVYLEFYSDYSTNAEGAGGHQMQVMAGAKNIAGDLTPSIPMVSPEWVVAQNPDVIFKTQLAQLCPSGYGVTDTEPVAVMLQDIKSRPSWELIKAVEDNRVYFISSDFFSSPRAPLGILYMAKCLYPGVFADVDPDEVNREWMMQFHDIDGDGLYCWPKVE